MRICRPLSRKFPEPSVPFPTLREPRLTPGVLFAFFGIQQQPPALVDVEVDKLASALGTDTVLIKQIFPRVCSTTTSFSKLHDFQDVYQNEAKTAR
jgi:hypothetical protein